VRAPPQRDRAAVGRQDVAQRRTELVALVDQHAPFLEGQLRERLADVGLGVLFVDDVAAARGDRRRPAGEALQGLLDRLLAVKLDQRSRRCDAALELGAQLRRYLLQREPRHTRVMLRDAALLDQLAI